MDSRFPTPVRKLAGGLATGVRSIDEALGGGLPAGRLTELVSGGPGSGGQLVLARLLMTTRMERKRIALVDVADGFSPDSVPPDALQHLVWVRPLNLADALAAMDVLVRDGNYAAVVLDLRGVGERVQLNIPKSHWHRLQRAAESRPAAVLIQTTVNVVPAVPGRLILTVPQGLSARRKTQDELLAHLGLAQVRGHALREERAG